MWSVMAIYLVISLCAALVSLGNSRPFGALPVAFSTGGGGKSDTLCQPCFSLRGGTSDDESEGDDYNSDVDESEDEEEDDTLLSSTVKATTKTQTKKTASVKKAVSAGLAEAAKTTTKSKKSKLRLPYLLRAIFNPLTVFAMTKAYWSSLFNLEYGKDKEDSSQNLRSALEEKAKKSTGGGARGRRKMKPGQAKTLSDLPQLNT